MSEYECPCQRCPRCGDLKIPNEEMAFTDHSGDGDSVCHKCRHAWWSYTGWDHMKNPLDEILRWVYDIRAYNGTLP